jgi:hypothetical protein
MASKMAIVTGLYSFMVCAIAVIIIVCSAILYSLLVNNAGEFDLIINNWSLDPIIDIEITDNAQCPASHPESFNYYLWPGT